MFRFLKDIDGRRIRKNVKEFFSNRIILLGMMISVLFFLLIYRLFVLQIVEGAEHEANFRYTVEKTVETSGSRGNIYDCNGNLLAYNQLAYKVTFEKSDKLKEIARSRSTQDHTVSENEVRNEITYNLIKLLESNKDSITYDLPLKIDSKGNLKFTESGSALTRFKKDIYGITNFDRLEDDEKKKAERWLNSTPQEVYEYLRTGEGGPVGVGKMFDISDSYSMEDTLKIMSIRFDSYMNRYSQTTPITVATNISERSIAEISEHSQQYPGVEIEVDSLRKYNDPMYFSNLVGYTGVISESEMEEYNENYEKDQQYSSSDIVGKTGIEKTMESVLRGTKGKTDVLVNNLGQIIKTVDTVDAKTGNDIYLTIDSDLQKYAYNILERRLAGIILAHLTTSTESGNDKMIPIFNVYFALFDNNVIDIDHIASKKAKTVEKKVYAIYKQKQKEVMSRLRNNMKNGNTAYKNLSEESQEYVSYIVNLLEKNEILNTSLINEEDEVYRDWKNRRCSLRKYLRHAISSEWIDISSFDIESDYYDADEIYDALVDYIIKELKGQEEFDKILYRYMITSKKLSGKNVCLLLFDQDILDKNDDYEALRKDEMSAYDFMSKKIKNIEITPAQLALDPCSGSVIITDPDNGDVKAMVSYPSYDNNKLANGIDSKYYGKLVEDKSSPMLNRCTQTRTAPGSTFKPITSTAVLEEGVVDEGDHVKCTGVFDKITPNAKCWIYPNAHGQLNVSGAIAVSCNFFFYEMGYQLGMKNGNYINKVGLKKIAKYASRYGLDRKSGVEISEYEPKLSDEDAVRSAIGQGTHNYTPSQISRYVTSLVNEKNLLNLTLLEKSTDSQGKVLEKYKKEAEEKLGFPDSTYGMIKKGMQDVVYGKDSSIRYLYQKLGLKVAGKTGTAQENKKRPNHALFISYAPFDKPDITMTVVVPNGYTSTNAAEIARDIYKYYFGKTTEKEEKEKTALIPTGNDSSND